LRIVTQAAADLLCVSIDERVQRLRQFLDERGLETPMPPTAIPPCPLGIEPDHPYVDHIEWVSRLSGTEIQSGTSWLQAVVDQYDREAR
jgi:hypothetical protein